MCLCVACSDRTPEAPRCAPARSEPIWHDEVLLEPEPPNLIGTGNVRQSDVLGNHQPELLLAEPLSAEVLWLRDCHGAGCSAERFTQGLKAPVRAQAVDVDGNAEIDTLVADIGILAAAPDLSGRVLLFRQVGGRFLPAEVLLEGVGRVASAEAADLDADGDQDIVVAVFGLVVGEILWLERTAPGRYARHRLSDKAGTIHAFPVDIDADGDVDIIAAISQDNEELVLFRNHGKGEFREEVLFAADNPDYGMSGISLADLDRDGDLDVLVTNGDYFDGKPIEFAELSQLHGLAWFENVAGRRFVRHEVSRRFGAYSVVALDVDRDCDLDLVLSTLRALQLLPADESWGPGVFWYENDGAEHFTEHTIDPTPPELVSLTTIDWNGDGHVEVVGGSLGVQPQSAHVRLVRLGPSYDAL